MLLAKKLNIKKLGYPLLVLLLASCSTQLEDRASIDFEPSIPGSQGDYVYVSNTGEFTTSDTGKIAFLKRKANIQTLFTDCGSNNIYHYNNCFFVPF